MQLKQSSLGIGFASLAGLALIAGCTRPTHDRAILIAVKAESQRLIAEYPTNTYVTVPQRKWPKAISSLKPELVTVYPYGVDILVKPYFDGGYGYLVPKQSGVLPKPVERFSEIDQDVYWYRPY